MINQTIINTRCYSLIFSSSLLVRALGEHPGVQDGAGDVVEGDLRLRLGQAQRHEPLAVVEELQLVRVGREDAVPRLGPATTC